MITQSHPLSALFSVSIGVWWRDRGLKIAHTLNYSDSLDDLYVTMVNFFGSLFSLYPKEIASNNTIKLTLPLKSRNQFARITVDYLLNDPEKTPIMIILFVPDDLDEKELPQFDPILREIGFDLIKNYPEIRGSYEDRLKSIFDTLSRPIGSEQEPLTEVTYSLASAADDFKKGVNYFQTKNWAIAYSLLFRAMKKFHEDQQISLELECKYLICTILVQTNKYSATLDYFGDIIRLALQLGHKKYSELTYFMQGFVYYKLHDYLAGNIAFDQIPISSAQFVNKVRYFTFKGRCLGKLGIHMEAISNFQEALKLTPSSDESSSQKAILYFEIGLQYYYLVMKLFRSKGFKELQNGSITLDYINAGILHLEQASSLYESLHEEKTLVSIYQYLAVFYKICNNTLRAVDYLEHAVSKTDILHNFEVKLQLIYRLLDDYNQLNQPQSIIQLLVATLEDFQKYTFIDFLTIGRFNLRLSQAYFRQHEYEGALIHGQYALKAYQQMHHPTEELCQVLVHLLAITKIIPSSSLQIQYETLLESTRLRLKNQKPIESGPILGAIRDFWFFNESGLELYSYTPSISLDSMLFMGFVSALQAMASELSKKQLDGFAIGDSSFVFYSEIGKNLFILGRTSIIESQDHINSLLKQIYQSFYQRFHPLLTHFSGETTPFREFTKIVQKMQLDVV